MLTYCLKCKKDTENVDSQMLKTKNGKPTLWSNCAVCCSKKSIKNQSILKNIPLLGKILF